MGNSGECSSTRTPVSSASTAPEDGENCSAHSDSYDIPLHPTGTGRRSSGSSKNAKPLFYFASCFFCIKLRQRRLHNAKYDMSNKTAIKNGKNSHKRKVYISKLFFITVKQCVLNTVAILLSNSSDDRLSEGIKSFYRGVATSWFKFAEPLYSGMMFILLGPPVQEKLKFFSSDTKKNAPYKPASHQHRLSSLGRRHNYIKTVHNTPGAVARWGH